jgi:hypothetical protein
VCGRRRGRAVGASVNRSGCSLPGPKRGRRRQADYSAARTGISPAPAHFAQTPSPRHVTHSQGDPSSPQATIPMPSQVGHRFVPRQAGHSPISIYSLSMFALLCDGGPSHPRSCPVPQTLRIRDQPRQFVGGTRMLL